MLYPLDYGSNSVAGPDDDGRAEAGSGEAAPPPRNSQGPAFQPGHHNGRPPAFRPGHDHRSRSPCPRSTVSVHMDRP